MKTLVQRGRTASYFTVGALWLGISINLFLSLTHTTTDSPYIQALRFTLVIVSTVFLLRGFQWARILLGIFGATSLFAVILAFVLVRGDSLPTQWQQIYLITVWITVGFLMFIPQAGVKAYQLSIRDK